jgi:Ca-activated chloride channel homolog
MPTRRSLSAAGLLTLCLVAAPAIAEGVVAFVSPRDGELVAGDTRFSFRVRDGADVARIDVYVGGTMAGSALPPGWSFHWTAPSTLVAAPIEAVAFDAADHQVERVRIRTAANVMEEWIDVRAVQLYPVVIDRGGRYVRGLPRDSFKVLDRGRPVEIEYFSEDLQGLSLAIVLDTSRSMTGKLSFVTEAASRLVERLGDGDTVSVYAFNHVVVAGPEVEIAAGADRSTIQTFVRGLVADGGTAMYDALSGVLRELAPARGRKAVILFSDGRDERSLLTLSQVTNRARQSEAIIYTVGAGGAGGDDARHDLETLARETGGDALFFDGYHKLDSVFESVLLDLRSQYALGWTPQDGESGIRPIEVRVPGHRVRCRPSYVYDKTKRP